MLNSKFLSLTSLLLVFPHFAGATTNSTKIALTKNSEIIVQGSSNFSAASRNQSAAYQQNQLPDGTNNRQDKTPALENNSQLYLKFENKSFSQEVGKFGSVIKVESEVSSAQNKGIINVDQGFIYGDSKDYGKIEIGDNLPVNQKMKVGPASFARGAGGINGNYLKYINLPTSSKFILIAAAPISHGGQAFSGSELNQNSIKILRNGSFNGSEDATKLNYYSPRIEGFQVGLSYTPSTARSLVSSTVFNGEDNSINNVISAGANYTNNFENFDYAFSITSENGKSNSNTQNNLSSYDIATTMAYFGFTFGASYGNWKKSTQYSGQNSKDAIYKTLGISYQFGHLSVSLANLKSSFQQNDYDATSLGLDYKLSRALMPYFEITQFSFKPQSSSENKGYVALAGFLVSF